MFPNPRVERARWAERVLAIALVLAAGLLFACDVNDDPLSAVQHPAPISKAGELPGSAAARRSSAPSRSELKLVFGDEFDREPLSKARWTTELPWGPVANKQELQRFTPDSLALVDGGLTMTARKRKAGTLDYTSGLVSSHGKFEFTYGYVEMRARAARGQGLWTALWLMAVPAHNFNEIDVAEFVGQNPYRVQTTLHYGPTKQRVTSTFTGPDFSAGYHTFAAAWKPDSIVWYVDGVERFRQTRRIPKVPMYVVADLAVGGNYPGPPDATTPFPADCRIDYIRVYSWR